MTPSWDSSIRRTQITSWKTYRSDWGSLGWNSTPTRRAGLSSGGLPNKTGNEEEKANRKRSTFWDRAQQALYLLALAPVVETTADKNCYGFRQQRSCADAMEHLCILTLLPSLAPLHLMLADTPWPHGFGATLASVGPLSEGFERSVASPLQPRRLRAMGRTV